MNLSDLKINKETKVLNVFFYDYLELFVREFFRAAKYDETKESPVDQRVKAACPDVYETVRKNRIKSRYEYLDRYKDSEHVNYEFVSDLVNSKYETTIFEIAAELGCLSDGFWETRRDALKWKNENYACLASEDYVSKMFENLQLQERKIRAAVEEGQLLVFWTGRNENDLCSFYYLMAQLKDATCPMIWMHLPENLSDADGQRISRWSAVPPEELAVPMSAAKVLSAETRQKLAAEWDRLAGENGEMRVYENGAVKSVGIDYYDDLIEKYVSEEPDEFRMIDVFVNLLGERTITVDEGVWVRRLFQLIDEGKLEYGGPYGWYDRKVDCLVRKCGGYGKV